MTNISIKILGDNTCLRHSFLAHFGQSFLIEIDDYKCLFDIGEFDNALVNNIDKFHLTLAQIDDIIISHAHFDHTAGLMQLVKGLTTQNLYTPEALFNPKLVEKQLQRYQVDVDLESLRSYPHQTILTQPVSLHPDLYATGPVDGEMIEQAMVIDLKERGIAVVVGCSHPGIEKLITKAKEITNNPKLFALIGGYHFVDMQPEEIDKQIEYLKKENPELIVPMHCTGLTASFKLKQVFGDRVVMSEAGSIGVGNTINLSPDLSIDMERRLN